MRNNIEAWIAVIAIALGGSTLLLASPAHANPDTDVLCSSNMAYRHGHEANCSSIGINSHGGGGAAMADRDGDGVKNGEDSDSWNPNVH